MDKLKIHDGSNKYKIQYEEDYRHGSAESPVTEVQDEDGETRSGSQTQQRKEYSLTKAERSRISLDGANEPRDALQNQYRNV